VCESGPRRPGLPTRPPFDRSIFHGPKMHSHFPVASGLGPDIMPAQEPVAISLHSWNGDDEQSVRKLPGDRTSPKPWPVNCRRGGKLPLRECLKLEPWRCRGASRQPATAVPIIAQ